MHDDAYIGGHSENNIKCVVRDDLAWKNQTTRYILPRHWLYEWFSQFHNCGTYSVLSRSPSIMLCVNFHSQQINDDDDDYELCIRLILRWRTQSRLYQVSIYLWVEQNGATHILRQRCRQLWTDFNNSFTVSELSSENENCWNWKWRRKSKWRCFWCAVTVVSRFTYVDLVVHIRGTSCLGLDVNKSTIIKSYHKAS